jgi:hypothetical protein
MNPAVGSIWTVRLYILRITLRERREIGANPFQYPDGQSPL